MGDVKYEVMWADNSGFAYLVKEDALGVQHSVRISRMELHALVGANGGLSWPSGYVELAMHSHVPTVRYPEPQYMMPTIDQLARSLFVTDSRVQAFASSVADDTRKAGPDFPDLHPDAFLLNIGKHDDVIAKMWARNEGGWRKESEWRASAMLRQCNRTAKVVKAGESK